MRGLHRAAVLLSPLLAFAALVPDELSSRPEPVNGLGATVLEYRMWPWLLAGAHKLTVIFSSPLLRHCQVSTLQIFTLLPALRVIEAR